MKLFGHPIHIMLVHFPSALFPMDFVFYLLSYWLDNPSLLVYVQYSLWGGTLMGCLAVLFGAFDLLQNIDKKELIKKIFLHGLINGFVILGYLILSMQAYAHHKNMINPDLTGIVIRATLVIMMIVGNYFGAELIIKHHILTKYK